MSEIEEFTNEQLLAELIQRSVIRAHRVHQVDRMNVGKRDEGVKFTTIPRYRLFLNLPDFYLEYVPGGYEHEFIRDFVDAEFLEKHAKWKIDRDEVEWQAVERLNE